MHIITIGEIFLKGKNRKKFESKLLHNIRAALQLKNNELQVLRNRYIIFKENAENLKYVFGINSYYKVEECEFGNLNEFCLNKINNEKTFRITAQRLDKDYPKTSIEIEKDIGAYIVEKRKLKVKLVDPEINIHVEILKNKAYIYTNPEKGLCGLPVGSSGTVYLQVNDEIKSTVANYLMMRRGCAMNLSSDIPLIRKFEHGFKIKIRELKDYDVLVSDQVINDLNFKEKDERFILRPLLGYTEKEINELYNKIKLM